ncbi:cache domain-containing protein [archaeon]|jgi:hypothetical protein|nr:cache domain-containing protein [archaeon]
MKFDLKYKLIILSIFIGVIPLIINSNLTYGFGKDSTEKQILSQINSVADLKKDSLNKWFSGERDNLKIQSRDFELILFLNGESSSNFSYQGILNRVDGFKESHGHKRIFITDKFGEVILSTEKKDVGEFSKESYVQSPLKSHNSYLGEVFNSPAGPVMFISEPIFDFDFDKNVMINDVIGIFVMEVDVEKEIFYPLETWRGRGETGEVLVVRRDGEEVLFLNELKHKENASLNFRIPLDSEFAKPAIFASDGKEGILRTLDYRGEEVLAAYRNINLLNWGLVVKIDAVEAFQDVFILRDRVSFVGFVLLFIVIFFAIFSSILVTRIERKRTDQLERFVKVTVGREKKMIELKKEIQTLGGKNGKKK